MAHDETSTRLTEIDALRGLAALAVVLFHYTTGFDEHFGRVSAPSVSFPLGYYGVNLFFIVSGFVIFMTLDKTRRPLDFVVSRFSRLFPAYWVAIALTFAVTHLLGLPGKLVDARTALANLMMIQGLFGIPLVDGVYWTLEVELLFYCGMLALYRLGRLHQIHWALAALLALRVLYFALQRLFGIDLPWTLYHLLILKHVPWFALGIAIHLATSARARQAPWTPRLTAAMAIASLLIVDTPFETGLACALATLALFAARGRVAPLRNRVLVWLGAISYPLYLVHENIGWSVLLRLAAWSLPTDLAIVLALAVALLIAAALHHGVEMPAMRLIRDFYRRRQARTLPPERRLPALRVLRALLVLLIVVVSAAAWLRWKTRGVDDTLAHRLQRIVATERRHVELPCQDIARRQPLVLLALGQSNAGNHGTPTPTPLPAITLIADGKCVQASDPLPGGTGSGASIWQRLPALLAERVPGRPIVVSLLAVDASNIDDWTDAGSPLRARLVAQVSAMQGLGLPASLVLWQQGEADARRGLDAPGYALRLASLAQILADAGSRAPILAARSTLCPQPSTAIRDAVATLVASDARFAPGPDTDALTGAALRDGCHFSEQGLTRAAALWAASIAAQLGRNAIGTP